MALLRALPVEFVVITRQSAFEPMARTLSVLVYVGTITDNFAMNTLGNRAVPVVPNMYLKICIYL